MTALEFDVLVSGGRVVSGELDARLSIGIRGERIEALLDHEVPATARQVIDATGLIVVPGGIDTHTHVDMPLTEDSFGQATQAAALGGTTTLIDFVPPMSPGQRLIEAVENRIAAINDSAVIDVGVHPMLNRADDLVLSDIKTVIDLGCTSFKMFTTYPENLVTDGDAWRLMRAISAHGGLPGFHAENHTILGEAQRKLVEGGRTAITDFAESRPALAETTAINTLCLLAKELGSPIWIFHVSGAAALRAITDARAMGVEAYAETCTHYLTFDDTVFTGPDPWRYVLSPPIRSKADQAVLWDGVADGTVQAVGSDHNAYSLATKRPTAIDFRDLPLGAPGVQVRTPMLWHQTVNVRGLSVSTFTEISAERSARALGMFPRKGAIRVGSDADLVLLDPAASWRGSDLEPSVDNSFDPYADEHGRGRPRHVLSRGRQLVRDGTFIAAPAGDHFLPRSPRS